MVGVSSTFWGQTVSTPTEETNKPILTGSVDGGSSAANDAMYEAMFPFKDGSTPDKRLPSPVGSDGNVIDLQTVELSAISTEDFNQAFHTAHQLELLHRFGGQLVLGTGDTRMDVLLGADGRTVLVLQHMTKSDISALSLADQTLIANYLGEPAVAGVAAQDLAAPNATIVPDETKAALALQWGVNIGASVDANRASAQKLIDDAIAVIIAASSEYSEIYLEQLELLKSMNANNALFAEGTIQSKVDAIKARFDRMHAFEALEAQTVINSGDADDVVPGYNSLDNNAAALSGLKVFVDEERRLLEVAKERISLASSEGNVDVALLVATLQLSYDISKEAELSLMAEELEQVNEMLKQYAVIQSLINDVLKSFPPGADSKTTRAPHPTLGGVDNNNTTIPIPGGNADFPVEFQRVLIMFDSFLSGPAVNGVGHPLEELYGISRPTDALLKFNTNTNTATTVQYDQTHWNILSTQVSDAVGLFNQRSQILTNDISSLSQEKTRHIELGQNSLERMRSLIEKMFA